MKRKSSSERKFIKFRIADWILSNYWKFKEKNKQ